MSPVIGSGSASFEARTTRILLALVVPTAGLAAFVAFLAAWGPDWPAQDFRAWLARHAGLVVWSNAWYSGDALISYSALYPLLGWAFGAALTGLLAVTAASAGAAGLAPRDSRRRAVGFQVSVALVLVADLLIGQVPFLAGVAFGVWALRAIAAGRTGPALLLVALCSLTSPIAGAFLVVAFPAFAVGYGASRAAPLLAGVAGPAVALAFGGIGGDFPFAQSSLIEIAVFCVATLAIARHRPIHVFVLTYLAVSIASLVVANPVGGDVARLGELVALPLAWHVAGHVRGGSRRLQVSLVAALAVLATAWSAYPAASAASRGAGDASQSSDFYSGLLHFLHRQDPRAGRLEVVFTREHWEAYWVARRFPIARGWERQTDLRANGVLYHPLTAAAYRRWLLRNAVGWVALPRAPIDYGGQAEADLLRHPPAYLHRVYGDAHWTVWRVRGARPVVSGAARLRELGTASFVLRFARQGTATVRVHGSDFWQVTAGRACVGTDEQGWTVVRARRPGPVTVRARLSWDAALGRSPSRC